MKIFERWSCFSGKQVMTHRGTNFDGIASHAVRVWMHSVEISVGKTFCEDGVHLYVCVADEPVYSLMVFGDQLQVLDEHGNKVDFDWLTIQSLPKLGGNLDSYNAVAAAWQQRFNIPVETTLRAVLDYYHAKFCGDSAGEVDGE